MFGEEVLMKKKRTIRLKDPKLRKIRTELRTLLVREANKRVGDLIKEQSNLRKTRPLHDEKYYQLYDELVNQENQLRKLKAASICSCANCTDRKEDHVFNPNTREWYCEKCYQRLKKGYTKRGKPNLFP